MKTAEKKQQKKILKVDKKGGYDFIVLKNGQLVPTAGHGACKACNCRGYIPDDGNCGNCGHHFSIHK